MTDLYQRLKALREQKKVAIPKRAVLPQNSRSAPNFPGEWLLCGEQTWTRTVEFPIDGRFWGLIGDDSESGTELRRNAHDFLCLDTETTGLSGGAGTVPFLVGWCRLSGENAQIRQFFLQDFGGEPDFVRAIDTELSTAKALCTYNGASFDLPLLRTRWILQARRFPSLPHEDCLHPARRLWKRTVGACSLKHIEEAVLGIQRHGDIPGALVPQKYFEYLRSGAGADFSTQLNEIFNHHVQDVLSLMLLRMVIAAIRRDPLSSHWQTRLGRAVPDPWGILAWCSPEQKLRLLKSQWQRGREPQWGLAYAAFCRSSGSPSDHMEALSVWYELWQNHRDQRALVAWLKMVEHRNKDPLLWKRGLIEIEHAVAELGSFPVLQADLARRTQRLQRCLAR